MKYLAFLLIKRPAITREPDAVRILTAARVNGGRNTGESDYYGRWAWPTGTWLQERIKSNAKKND